MSYPKSRLTFFSIVNAIDVICVALSERKQITQHAEKTKSTKFRDEKYLHNHLKPANIIAQQAS